MNTNYGIGKHWLFNVPPSWILTGTVVHEDDTHVVIDDGLYIESIGHDVSAIGGIPMATTIRDMAKVITKAYALPDGFIMRKEAVLMRAPCAGNVKSLCKHLFK